MKLDEAIWHAYQAHDGVLDKAGEPYIKHPLRVMRRSMDEFRLITALSWDIQDMWVVAVLHDVWEDTDYKLHHLNRPQSAAMAAITRHFADDSQGECFIGETYKEYIMRCCKNTIARSVKYFDLLDNLDPQRISYLDKGERKGMTKRYEWSLDYIKKVGI